MTLELLPGPEDDVDGIPDITLCIQILGDRILPGLSHLSTFSLTSGPTGFEIPHEALISLVESLPPACVNLELDVWDFKDDWNSPGDPL